ncbi:MAG: phosphoglucosamine mutase [Deltaproteobacteria bacterium]|nr:phosphoglucosamine mutase [Deltaproteobacteria bacterium]
MEKLFGTDGIRGRADEYPMTQEIASRVGYAIASMFSDVKGNSKILIGKDTRASGAKFEKAIITGVCKLNSKAYLSGIIPTPGISYIVSSKGFDAGIVISASHNPYYDNGLKIFDRNGRKLSEKKEAEIEKLILSNNIPEIQISEGNISYANEYNNAVDDYSDFLKQCLAQGISLKAQKMVIDCANGSTCMIAPKLFSDLGAEVEAMYITPDGKNINNHCGSEHPGSMRTKVKEKEADIGIAFDGDGDRLIVADETGDILTGDQILAILASFLKKQGKLNKNTVVSTIMSNMGLGAALRNMNIEHITTKVGDRYVAEKMLETGSILGGEDSGHIILMNKQKTGDGLVTALKLLEIMKLEEKPLSELKKIMTIYPQALINVEAKSKPDLNDFSEVIDTINTVEKKLGKEGRVLVRYSGTEPICRVMIEGPNSEETVKQCQKIADIVKKNIG